MKWNYFKWLMAIVGLMLTVVISPIYTQSDLALTTTILNARSGPGTDYGVLGQLPHATTVAMVGRSEAGDWLMVRSVEDGLEGWVSTGYLSIASGFNVMGLPQVGAMDTPAQPATSDNPAVAPSSGVSSGTGSTISTLNVRSGPDVSYAPIGGIAVNTDVVIEGRNAVGNWLLMRAVDGSVRGWVASRYINFDGDLTLAGIPVTEGVVTEVITAPTSGNDVEPSLADHPIYQRLNNTPLFHNFGTSRVVAIYRLGQTYENRPNVFMKVGDSVTDSQPFLLAYGQGSGYNLGGYEYLQDTINHFAGVSPRNGVANSFTNRSFAAITGATSNSMLDGLWADPGSCAGTSPLMCEINLTRPSVALMLFGTQDMRVLSPQDFSFYMSQNIEAMSSNGVIPVLSTFHTHPDYYYDEALVFNNIILDLAEQYQVPLINLWKATQPLPDYGVRLDDPVHLTQGIDNYYNFTGEEGTYGINTRNLLSLQALDILRTTILNR